MSVPTTHSAAVLPKPQVKHEIQSRATPSSPAPTDLLVRITATAINPVDWKIRDYNVLLTEFPAVLGSDAAGEVVATGSSAEAQAFSPGDRVFFQSIIGNYDAATFQQYATIPAALVGRTPANTSDAEAATIPVASMAVVTGFYDQSGQGLSPPWTQGGADVGKGKAAVVLGGSSSIGQYAIQFARLSGFEKIITSSSASHRDFLSSLGATTALDRAHASAQDFKDAAGGLEVAFVLDAVSLPDTQVLAVEILKKFNGGNVVVVQSPDENAVKLGKQDGKAVEIKMVMGAGSAPHLRYLSEPLMKALGGEDGFLASEKFLPNRPEVVPGGLGALEEALERNKKGVSGVKIVIQPNEK